MKKIVEYWKKTKAWLEERSDKQRLLVLVAVLMGVLAVWYLFLYMPVKGAQLKANMLMEAAKKQLKIFQDKADLIVEEAKNSPAKQLRAKQEQLKKDLAQISSQLGGYDAQTLEPEEVVPAFRRLLLSNNIQLTALERTSVIPLSTKMKGGKTLWQTNFTIEFTGNYSDTLKYLQSLENEKFGIFWQGLDYTVEKYPEANVKLNIYSLSSESPSESEEQSNS